MPAARRKARKGPGPAGRGGTGGGGAGRGRGGGRAAGAGRATVLSDYPASEPRAPCKWSSALGLGLRV